MKYQVGITIHNSFEVEADSEAEAEYLVREFTSRKLLEDSDFKVTYNDKITEERLYENFQEQLDITKFVKDNE